RVSSDGLSAVSSRVSEPLPLSPRLRSASAICSVSRLPTRSQARRAPSATRCTPRLTVWGRGSPRVSKRSLRPLPRASPRPHPEPPTPAAWLPVRSEEHTSELQSRENLVCRLLL